MGSGGSQTLWPPSNEAGVGERGNVFQIVHKGWIVIHPAIQQPRVVDGGVKLSSAKRAISIG